MLKISKCALLVMLVGLLASPAMAQDEAPEEIIEGGQGVLDDAYGKGSGGYRAIALLGVCLGVGLIAVGGGMAIAKIGAACIESIARQPEAGGSMFAPMVVAAAMIEGAMFFAILVCAYVVMES